LGTGFLITHELDAIANHEWRMLPLLNSMTDANAESVFVLAHVPLFALLLALSSSLNPKTRKVTQVVLCAFLIVHGLLHYFLSDQPGYEFESWVSSLLIYGAAFCGVAWFLAWRFENSAGTV